MHAFATDRAYVRVDSVSKIAKITASPSINTFFAPKRSSSFFTGSCRFKLKCEAGLSPRDSRSCVILVEPRTSALMITCETT